VSSSPSTVSSTSDSQVNGLYCFVQILADDSRSLGFSELFLFNRAGSSTFSYFIMPASSLHFVDFPAPGRHTYKVQLKKGGDGNPGIYGRLVAYEL